MQGSSNLRTQSVNDIGQIDSLDLTVLYDDNSNHALLDNVGLSILVETDNMTVLFDTGSSGSILRKNSDSLNKDLSEVDFVVISHDHYDHIGGLSYIAEVNPDVTVYVPHLIDNQIFISINLLDLNIIKINETTIMQPGFVIIGALLGQLFGEVYEQALIVNVADVGLISFIGACHPGLVNIIEKVSTDLGYGPYMVIGCTNMMFTNMMSTTIEQDMNDIIERLLDLDVEKIFPIHTSGSTFRNYLAERYPQQYGGGNVGFQLTINNNTINYSKSLPITNQNKPLPIIYFILIPVGIIALIVPIGWIIRKKILGKRV